MKIYAPDQRFVCILSVPTLSIQDEKCIKWIFRHLASRFKEESRNVSDRQFATIKELVITENKENYRNSKEL